MYIQYNLIIMELTSFCQKHYFVNVYSQHLHFVFEFFQDHNESFFLLKIQTTLYEGITSQTWKKSQQQTNFYLFFDNFYS